MHQAVNAKCQGLYDQHIGKFIYHQSRQKVCLAEDHTAASGIADFFTVIPCLLHTHLQKCLINLLMTVSCHHPHTDFGIAVDKAFAKSVAVKIMYCHDISVLKASEDTCNLIVKDPQSA